MTVINQRRKTHHSNTVLAEPPFRCRTGTKNITQSLQSQKQNQMAKWVRLNHAFVLGPPSDPRQPSQPDARQSVPSVAPKANDSDFGPNKRFEHLVGTCGVCMHSVGICTVCTVRSTWLATTRTPPPSSIRHPSHHEYEGRKGGREFDPSRFAGDSKARSAQAQHSTATTTRSNSPD